MHVNTRCYFKRLSIKNDRLRQSPITAANLIDLSIRTYLYLQITNNVVITTMYYSKKKKKERKFINRFTLYDEIVK